jgi:tetratricopeptide (TPR) repeat protein
MSSVRATKPGAKRNSSTKVRVQGEPRRKAPRDQVKEDYEHALKADYFSQLGRHWTDSPSHLDLGIESLRDAYGPDSNAAARSPEFAAKRLQLGERAFERLSSVSGRRLYREELGVDVRSAAELLDQQAKLDLRRKDYAEAIDKLEAAMDLSPTNGRKRALDTIKQRLREQGGS